MDEMTAFERQVATVIRQASRSPRPVDATAIVRSVTTGAQKRQWATMIGATRHALAGAFVALIAGLLILGVLPPHSHERSRPAALASADATAIPRIVTSAASDMALTRPSPTVDVHAWLTPSARTGGERPLRWESDGIELAADALALRTGDIVATAVGEVLPMGTMYADHAQLRLTWFENEVQQGLVFELVVDDTHWWVDEIRASAHRQDWTYFEDLAELTRTPIGESLEGDLRAEAFDAIWSVNPDGWVSLELDGLRLTAFEPGSRPAPLTGCEYVDDPRIEVTWEEYGYEEGGYWSTRVSGRPLQGPGEPLEGVKRMSPREVEAILQDLGLCYRFNHSWRPTRRFEDERLDRALEGYGDRRCSAPATGRVTELSFSVDHPSGGPGVIAYVDVRETKERDWPDPPPQGTDCPSQ